MVLFVTPWEVRPRCRSFRRSSRECREGRSSRSTSRTPGRRRSGSGSRIPPPCPRSRRQRSPPAELDAGGSLDPGRSRGRDDDDDLRRDEDPQGQVAADQATGLHRASALVGDAVTERARGIGRRHVTRSRRHGRLAGQPPYASHSPLARMYSRACAKGISARRPASSLRAQAPPGAAGSARYPSSPKAPLTMDRSVVVADGARGFVWFSAMATTTDVRPCVSLAR